MRTSFILLALSLISPITLLAQNPVPIQEAMRVNLVELEVKVKDLRGRFVSGLSPEDFKVFEDGKEQEIDDFQEIELFRLPDEEIQDYRSRVMILLDFQNTQYNRMARVFDEIHTFVDMYYTDNTELGLAVNAGGIAVIASFTRDRDVLHKAIDTARDLHAQGRDRRWEINPLPASQTDAVSAQFIVPRPSDEDGNYYAERLGTNYYRDQLDVLGQFVRYVGAYKGKKNIVMVTDTWDQGQAFSQAEGEVNSDGLTSLKDIQTTCLQHKVAINVVSMIRNRSIVNNRRSRGGLAQPRLNDRAADLAVTTSGYHFLGNHMQVDKFLERSLEHAEQYYRIRYYSDSDRRTFRDIKVRVKGMGRIAQTFQGYFPDRKDVDGAQHRVDLDETSRFTYNLSVDTDWMRFNWEGFKKRRANYVLAQRLYDDSGRLVDEYVSAGSLQKRKYEGHYNAAPLKRTIRFQAPAGQVPVLLELVITDLATGKTLTFKHDMAADGDS